MTRTAPAGEPLRSVRTVMIIRLLTPADEEEWLRMRLALWPTHDAEAHRADMAAWLGRSNTVVLVAERPGSGLGGFAEVGTRPYADGCRTSPVAYLEGWYVDPDLRRRGVGAALVRVAEAWARELGCRELASDALLENLVSQQAHRALAFREVERSVKYSKLL